MQPETERNVMNEHIEMLYKQYYSTKSHKAKKDLYKAIKRAEGKRRKEKTKDVIII